MRPKSAETSEPACVKRKMLSTKNSTSLPPWSRKYSASVRPESATRARAPGGSFIWPNTNVAWLSLSTSSRPVQVPAAFLHRVQERVAVLDDARLQHLAHEVVALARALADAGEDRHAVVALGDVVDELLDEHRLADARAAEEADLAATRVGLDQVDDLDAGLQHLDARRQLVVRRRLGVDRAVLGHLRLGQAVDGLADDVEEAAADGLADGHLDRAAGVGHLVPRWRPSVESIEMVRTRFSPRCCCTSSTSGGRPVAGDLERVEDLGHEPDVELAVDDGADDLEDAPVVTAVGAATPAGCGFPSGSVRA